MPGAKTQTNGAGCFLWHGKYLSKILSEKITCSVVKKFPWIWSDFLPSSLFLGVTDMMSVDWCVFERDFFPRSTFSSSACLSAAKKCLGSQSSEWWISDVSSINRTVYSLFSSDLLRKLCRKSPVLMAWGFEANWKWDRERAFICRWQRKGEEEKKRPVSGRAMEREREHWKFCGEKGRKEMLEKVVQWAWKYMSARKNANHFSSNSHEVSEFWSLRIKKAKGRFNLFLSTCTRLHIPIVT